MFINNLDSNDRVLYVVSYIMFYILYHSEIVKKAMLFMETEKFYVIL